MTLSQPKKKFIHFHRREGRFNLLSSEPQVQYWFVFPNLTIEELKNLGIEDAFYLDPDKEYFNSEGYSALDVAYELHDVYKDYFFHSSKDKIIALKTYLDSVEEEQALLRHQYEIEYAEYKVKHWQDKVVALKSLK